MSPERFFSRVKQDIFRPFTGRHRGIAFEVTVDLYDRLLGAAAGRVRVDRTVPKARLLISASLASDPALRITRASPECAK